MTRPEPDPRVPASREPLRVLIVEDEIELATRWANALGILRPDARIAGSLAQARSVLQEWQWLDGVLLDLGLPDGKGTELLEDLRAFEPAPGVAVVTGLATPNRLRIQLHPVPVLNKPLTDEDLSLLAETVLGRFNPIQRALLELGRIRGLSARKRQLLLCAVRGLSHEQAARELGCSVGTIKTQWGRLFEQLDLRRDDPNPDGYHLQQRVVQMILEVASRQFRLGESTRPRASRRASGSVRKVETAEFARTGTKP